MCTFPVIHCCKNKYIPYMYCCRICLHFLLLSIVEAKSPYMYCCETACMCATGLNELVKFAGACRRGAWTGQPCHLLSGY